MSVSSLAQSPVRIRFRALAALGFALLLLLLLALGLYGLFQARAVRDELWQVVQVQNRTQDRSGHGHPGGGLPALRQPVQHARGVGSLRPRQLVHGLQQGRLRCRRGPGGYREAPLTAAERAEYARQSALIADVVQVQDTIVDLLSGDEIDGARALLLDRALPLQDAINDSFAALRGIAREDTAQALARTSRTYLWTLRLSIGLMVAALVLAVAIAVLVLRRLRRQERDIGGYIDALTDTNAALERSRALIRRTFGRYLSEDIVAAILSAPDGSGLPAEKRSLTLLMADLRGFTPFVMSHDAEAVPALLNTYIEVMSDIIFRFGGTIDEIQGDGILAIFGAPVANADHADRAVACALAMQLAIPEVNRRLAAAGLPAVSLGIGLDTGEVVVGTLGSDQRAKYSVVGAHINLVARIESCTRGGQVLASADTLRACTSALEIRGTRDIRLKGIDRTLPISEISGIAGRWGLRLPQPGPPRLRPLRPRVRVDAFPLAGKVVSGAMAQGELTHYGGDCLVLRSATQPAPLTDLRLVLTDLGGPEAGRTLYGKVQPPEPGQPGPLVAISSQPPGAQRYLEAKAGALPDAAAAPSDTVEA